MAVVLSEDRPDELDRLVTRMRTCKPTQHETIAAKFAELQALIAAGSCYFDDSGFEAQQLLDKAACAWDSTYSRFA